MKILICYPPLKSKKGVPLLSQNRQFQWFNNPSYMYPVILASAATLLDKNGYEVIWKDSIVENDTEEQFYEFFQETNPDLVAIETKTPVIEQHWKIIDKLKEILPKTKIVLLGDHVTALPEESMEKCEVDFILTGGDYDFMLLDLCNTLKNKKQLPRGVYYRKRGKIENTGKFRLNHDLNSLPRIDRELTKAKLYDVEYNMKQKPFAYTMVGRDCPWHKCKFCSWPTLFPKFRVRSTESLLDEIGYLIDTYHVKEIFDDTGTFPGGEWLTKFCEGLIKRDYNKKIRFSCNMRVDFINEKNVELMRKAGFRLLKIGLESANQETLDKINKNITVEQINHACKMARNAGLEVHLTMMLGYPWETKAQAMNTYNLTKELMQSGDADILQSTVLIPYPGTQLHKEAVENNWFLFDPKEYSKYDMSEPVLKTPDMSPKQVMDICQKVYKIFLSPRYVAKHLIKIRNIPDIKYHLKGAKAIFGHLKDFARLK